MTQQYVRVQNAANTSVYSQTAQQYVHVQSAANTSVYSQTELSYIHVLRVTSVIMCGLSLSAAESRAVSCF
jgi:hypothetical protein